MRTCLEELSPLYFYEMGIAGELQLDFLLNISKHIKIWINC